MPSDTIDRWALAWCETLDPDACGKLRRRIDVVNPAIVIARDPDREQIAAAWLTDPWEAAWITAAPGAPDDLPEIVAAAAWDARRVSSDLMNTALARDAIRAAAERAMVDTGWTAAYAAAGSALTPEVARRLYQCSSLRAQLVAYAGPADPWRATGGREVGETYGCHFTEAWTRLAPTVTFLRERAETLLDLMIAA